MTVVQATPSPSVSSAAAAWISGDGIAGAVRDARRHDLGVIARELATILGRPAAETEGPWYVRELDRLGWDDLRATLLARAIASYSLDHSPTTRQRILASWSAFLRWSEEAGLRTAELDAASATPLSRLAAGAESAPPRTGWPEAVAAVITAGGRGRDAWPDRDQAMVGVIVAGGLRLGEVASLRMSDLRDTDTGPRALIARSHTGRRWTVQWPALVDAAMDRYLESREERRIDTAPTSALFVHTSGKPYTFEALRYVVTGWFKKAGVEVPKGAMPGRLRPVYEELFG